MKTNFIKKCSTKLLTLAVAALTALPLSAETFIGNRDDFRDETIYFVITTRFYDGDKTNNTMCWDAQEANAGDPEWRGDFKGLIEKLDYIKALGFTAVWITPVVQNASGLDYHGYHASNFSKVDKRYESEDVKFQDLIDAAHEKGMKIILDIVLNHTGNFGEENLCKLFERDYTANQADINACMKPVTQKDGGFLPDNYNDLIPGDQYSTRLAMMKNTDGQNHDTHNYWHHYGYFSWDDYTRWYGQIAGDCVDLNTENPAVSDYLVKCYGEFIKMGVDGFLIDTSGHFARLTFNNAFIPQFKELAEKYKDKRADGQAFFMFGEVCARSQEVIYRNTQNCSPFFYTWKETKNYEWTDDATTWDNLFVKEGGLGDQVNMNSTLQQGIDYSGTDNMPTSENAFLNGNKYHAPDYSEYSGFSVIDFAMHRRFASAQNAYRVKDQDGFYNDASYNVVYVDSHDYAPESEENVRFTGDQSTWAENLSLMFSFRGIPCLYYGSEVEFKKGEPIDPGTSAPLRNSGRAYYGGYITGDVTATDFGEYTATGNAAASLSYPLSRHIQRLNKIRAAVPALRKGQYSTEGCEGTFAFKRRFTDSTTDSYCLVTISGDATFTGIENGTYTDAVTGDTRTVTDGTMSVSCTGKGNMRVYVLDTDKTKAPGKIGEDGKYLYATSSVEQEQSEYDGQEEALLPETDYQHGTSTGGGSTEEPENPVELSMKEGEQAVFFESPEDWGKNIKAWVWNDNANFTGGTWPGESMTYLGNNIWKWNYTGSDKITGHVIFNNGSSSKQTADLDWVNGGYYNAGGYVKTIEGAGEIPDKPETETTWTVYFKDNESSAWNPVYVYIWDDANKKEYIGGWPGTMMTQGSDGKWSYTFTTTGNISSPMVIFNNGNSGVGTNQTADLTLTNNSKYNRNGIITEITPVPGTVTGLENFKYKYLRSYSNEYAQELPDGVDCYVVSGFKASSGADGEGGTATLTKIDFIPANTGVILASETVNDIQPND